VDRLRYWAICDACKLKQVLPNMAIAVGHVPPCKECGATLNKVYRTHIGAISVKPALREAKG
jgi:hypothetical protein